MKFSFSWLGASWLRRSHVHRPRAATHAGSCELTLERLEERWAPAIGVVVDSDSHVTIVDDDAARTANRIVIIDDLSDRNTYIRINGAPRVRLNGNAGADGVLQNLSIDMGSGNDVVMFETLNGPPPGQNLDREIELGLGDDKFSFLTAPFQSLNAAMVYDLTDAGGNDVYTFRGNVGFAEWSVFINDAWGNDVYSFTPFGSPTLGSSLTANFLLDVFDDGAGNNKFGLYQGAGQDLAITISVSFVGGGNNAFAVSGFRGSRFEFTSFDLTFNGGDGRDTVVIDDVFVNVPGSRYDVDIDLGAGDDKVALKFDDPIAFGLLAVFDVLLGEGDDVFTATFHPRTFFIDSLSTEATGLSIGVDGNEGDDKITVESKGSGALGVFNDDSFLYLVLLGGEGDDVISVDYGRFQFAAAAQTFFSLVVDAGEGADTVRLAGTALDCVNAYFTLEITLGADEDVDAFVSTFKSAAGAVESPVFLSLFIEAGEADKIKIRHLFFDVSLADFLLIG